MSNSPILLAGGSGGKPLQRYVYWGAFSNLANTGTHGGVYGYQDVTVAVSNWENCHVEWNTIDATNGSNASACYLTSNTNLRVTFLDNNNGYNVYYFVVIYRWA